MSGRIWFSWIALFSIGFALQALEVEPLRGNGASLGWPAAQFIQADSHGKVYVLRGDTWEVYPVTKSHELGEPAALAATPLSGHLLDAAMSSHGDWALLVGTEVHSFTGGKERAALPALPWFPSGIGFLRGEPVALVVPPRLGGTGEDDSPPLLLTLGHDSWSAEAREPLHGAARDYDDAMLRRAALTLDAGQGRYYLARQYAYRIELRRLGRVAPLADLRLGKGEPLLKKKPEEDTRRLRDQAKAEGIDLQGATVSAFHGAFAILALASGGPDDRLYVLDGPGIAGDGCSLDRINWEARRVERTSLGLACNGRMTMAAGRDGLYLAKHRADGGGRYFVSWAAVEGAKWSPVKGVELTP